MLDYTSKVNNILIVNLVIKPKILQIISNLLCISSCMMMRRTSIRILSLKWGVIVTLLGKSYIDNA